MKTKQILKKAYKDNLKLELESRMLMTCSAYKNELYVRFVDSLSIKQCIMLTGILEELR